MNYSTADIRQFLIEAFNDEELTTFCFDRFSDVYQSFAVGMTKGQKVQLLLEHCQNYKTTSDLVAALAQTRPTQFQQRFGSADVVTIAQEVHLTTIHSKWIKQIDVKWWAGIIIASLACIAAWLVVPEFRQLLPNVFAPSATVIPESSGTLAALDSKPMLTRPTDSISNQLPAGGSGASSSMSGPMATITSVASIRPAVQVTAVISGLFYLRSKPKSDSNTSAILSPGIEITIFEVSLDKQYLHIQTVRSNTIITGWIQYVREFLPSIDIETLPLVACPGGQGWDKLVGECRAPTLTPTPITSCPFGQIFDPVMNRCRETSGPPPPTQEKP
jgi:hypothetical protein